MNRMNQRREGFALATAIVALVIVGALVTGGFYAAGQESRVSTSVQQAEAAFNVAEHGIDRVVGTWNLAQYEAIPVGDTAVVVDSLTVGTEVIGRATVQVRRLATRLYFVSSTSEVLTGGRYAAGRRTLGMLLQTTFFGISRDRAVSVLGQLNVSGSSKIVGSDSVNPAWGTGDCENLGDVSGVVTADSSLVGVTGGASIEGDPPVVEDAAMDTTTFDDLGQWSYDELAALAGVTIPASSTINNTAPSHTPEGYCDRSDDRNWGAPRDTTDVCHYYFPIIHALGDLTINSSAAGQGILLVDGDLRVAGGYEFSGVILIRGHFETGSGGANIYGTMMIRSDGSSLGDPSDILGNPIVNFSSCAVDRAVKYNSAFARAFPVAERSWVDLSATGFEM